MPVAATSTRPNKATVVAVRLAPQDTAAIDASASRTEMRQAGRRQMSSPVPIQRKRLSRSDGVSPRSVRGAISRVS